MADLNTLLTPLLISFGIQILFFSWAAWQKSDKVTDLSYGLTFIILATYLFFINITYGLVQLLYFWAIIIWGTRLTAYLFQRILTIKKDRRFDDIRENIPKFAGFWFFQAITVWIIMIPAVFVLTDQEKIIPGPLVWSGFLIWGIGLLIESVADKQKFNFKNEPENKDKWIESGLWRYSRHPNYFGEMMIWWGLFLVAIPFLEGWQYLGVAGPLFITFILLFVSGIPPLEKRYEKKYGQKKAYREYKKRTSLLIPLLPKE